MLAFRLVAHGIGGRTVAELADAMDVEEFLTWAAYAQVEPFGEERQDWRNAMLLAMQANMNRPKGAPPIPPARFLPRFEAGMPKKKTPEEIRAALTAWGASWGATDGDTEAIRGAGA